eukprot:368616-Amphidinium_carterae.1
MRFSSQHVSVGKLEEAVPQTARPPRSAASKWEKLHQQGYINSSLDVQVVSGNQDPVSCTRRRQIGIARTASVRQMCWMENAYPFTKGLTDTKELCSTSK